MTKNQNPKPDFKSSLTRFFSTDICLWFSFLLFCAVHFLLSSYPSSLSGKLWIALAGCGFPLLLLSIFGRPSLKPGSHLYEGEIISPPGPRTLVLLAILAACLRFYHLTSLLRWPLKDEGIFGYYALRLSETWNLTLIQGFNHLPTLFTWIQAVIFKLFGPSLFSLWVYPALWSLLLIPAAWFAARGFFSRSLSLIIAGFMAFSFWPLWLGRFSTQAGFMVFWECLAFGALASYWKAGPDYKSRRLLWLGLATGLGFYTYLPWASIAGVISLGLMGKWLGTRGEKNPPPLLFFLVIGLAALPLIMSFNESHRGYLQHLWGGAGVNFDWNSRLNLYGNYFADLFWGAVQSTFHYGPLRGGFLNPLLGGFFFLGLASLLRSLPDSRSLWILVSIPLLFLPAFLTNDFEDMRLVQLIPFLAVLSGFGIQSLLDTLPQGKRLLSLFLIFAASLSLDGYHLFAVAQNHWPANQAYYGFHKSVKYFRAFPILTQKAGKDGPGIILQNFDPDFYDQTLYVASYSFNAGENPHLNPQTAKWFAIITNIHEQPYLKKAFPGGQWTWLSTGLNLRDGGFILQMADITPQNRDLILQWLRADLSLKDINFLVMEKGVTPDQTDMLTVLEKAYPIFKGDRLLESRFWRMKALHDSAANNVKAALEDEEKAIRLGFPMAHLYNEMGCLLYEQNRVPEAKNAFETAIHLRPNCTDAAVNLNNLLLSRRENIPSKN